jgi:hypothetical protein
LWVLSHHASDLTTGDEEDDDELVIDGSYKSLAFKNVDKIQDVLDIIMP